MQKIEILVLLKLIGQKIGFDEIQENRSYEGKVLSTIIEHDGNHKLCVEIGEDNCEIFDVKNLINLRKDTLWKPLFSGVDWDFVNIPRQDECGVIQKQQIADTAHTPNARRSVVVPPSPSRLFAYVYVSAAEHA